MVSKIPILLCVTSQLVIYSSVAFSDVVHTELEEFKIFCYPTELNRDDVVYTHTRSLGMAALLNNILSNVEKLHISVEPVSGYQSDIIDFNNIHRLHNLTELWIVGDTRRHVKRMTLGYGNNSHPLSVRQLHLHLSYDVDNGDLYRFIRSMPNLELLDCAGFKTTQNMTSVIQALQHKPIKGLKLNELQSPVTQDLFHIIPRVFFDTIKNGSLECLDLSHNNIMSFEVGLTTVLPHIRIINLSKNMLNSDPNNYNALLEFLLNPTVEVINASQQGLSISTPQRPTYKISSTSDKHPLKFNKECEKYLLPAVTEGDRASVCRLAQCIAATNISCEIFPLHMQTSFLLDFSCNPPIKFPIGKNISELFLDNMNILANQAYNHPEINTICFAANNLKKLSYSDNAQYLHYRLYSEVIVGSTFRGLESLSTFDCGFNGLNITLPTAEFLLRYTNLRELKLQGNYISLNKSDSVQVCVLHSKIVHLDISQSNIQEIPHGFFKNCTGLLHLNLAFNNIDEAELGSDLLNMLHIDLLNVSNNHIQYFTKKVRDILRENHGEANVSIDFSGNPFKCACSDDSIETVRLLQDFREKNIFVGLDEYVCFFTYVSTGYQFITKIKLEDVEQLCYPKRLPVLLISLTVISIIIAICSSSVLAWKYRFHVFTFYYRSKLKLITPTQSVFKYDVFIVYCSEDRFWVHGVLMKTLQEKYNFKLCIHYRDFLIGEDIDDEIVKHMSDSKAHIVVISENSVRKHWPTFELKRAYTEHIEKKKDLIVIKFGDIHTVELPGIVQQIMDAKIYLQWPEAKKGCVSIRTQRRQELFWARLASRLYGGEYPCYLRHKCCTESIQSGSIDDYLEESTELL